MNTVSQILLVEEQQIRHVSKGTVLEESFLSGRYVIRYLNANAQIMPYLHFLPGRWKKEEKADAFQLTVNGSSTAGKLKWIDAEISKDSQTSRIHLQYPEDRLSIWIHTKTTGDGFLVRSLELLNEGDKPLAINAVSPLSGGIWEHRSNPVLLPKGEEGPFHAYYTHCHGWGEEGDFYGECLKPGLTAIDGGMTGKSGWGRPAFWLRNLCNGQTFVCELAWSGNWKAEWEISKGEYKKLFYSIGLNSTEEVLYSLAPGERIQTPEVHFALYQAGTDEIVHAIHHHVRTEVLPPLPPNRFCELEANHRGYLPDRESVPSILNDVDLAESVGVELYVIDAGWYGAEPNQWYTNVGDWHDGAWMKNGGVKAISDYVHSKGMKFGLWVEIEAAGATSTLRREHPEWLLRRDGVPVANGRALDLTNPEVYEFSKQTISRLIRELNLDMYRLDNNHCMAPFPAEVRNGIREDSTWRYFRALYCLFEELKSEFPDVVFQNCSGGGGRTDWGIMRYFHNQEISDFARLPRGFKILNGMTLFFPPETLLRIYGTEASDHEFDGGLNAQFLHPFSKMILRGIAPSFAELPAEMEQRIHSFITCYKERIRPIMQNGKTYHHTPFLPVLESTPWCVLEYAAPDESAAACAVLHTSCRESSYTLRPRGIAPGKKYIVECFFSKRSWETYGWQLAEAGIYLLLKQPLAAELILLREIE